MPKNSDPKISEKVVSETAKLPGDASARRSTAKKAGKPKAKAVAGKSASSRKPASSKQTAKPRRKPPSAVGPASGERSQTQSSPIHQDAHVLLDLHVQHELAACDPAALLPWLRQNTKVILAWTKVTKLDDLVDRDQVKSAFRRHIVAGEVPQDFARLTQEAALQVLKSANHQNTLLGDLMTQAQFESFVEQMLVFEEQRSSILNSLIDLPVYGELISGVVFEAITRYIYESNILTKKIPGMSSMLKMGRNVVNKTAPKLGGAVEESVRSYIAANLKFILQESKYFLDNSLTENHVRESALGIWDTLADQTLEELQMSNDNEQLAVLVRLGYDLGLSVRETPYFALCNEALVDSFFDHYGRRPLAELMADLAIDGDWIMAEIEYFVPKIINELKAGGQLEELLRSRLQDFYSSASVFAFFESKQQ